MVGEVAQGLRAAGQAQQHDADVLRHRQQHLAQHLGLRLGVLRAPLRALLPARGELQALQAAQADGQVGDRLAERGGELLRGILEEIRRGEEQRGEARVEVELERSRHQRHAEGVLPDRLARAEGEFAVQVPGVIGRPRQRLARLARQAFGEQIERRLAGAGLGNGMGDGDHVRKRAKAVGELSPKSVSSPQPSPPAGRGSVHAAVSWGLTFALLPPLPLAGRGMGRGWKV